MQRKTKWIASGAVAVALALGAAGAVAGVANADDEGAPLTGETFDSATAAALAEVGGGRVIEAELDDGRYEIEVRREDVTTVEVVVGTDFEVVGTEADEDDDGGSEDDSITGEELARVSSAALAAVGGGTVTEAEREADGTYEVEVATEDGRELDVRLDADLAVIGTPTDD